MTGAAAPAPEHVKVICSRCGTPAYIWITQEEIEAMGFTWLPLDYAYSHVCGACLYQRIPADAPLHMPRINDPERSAHSRRASGGYHKREWRVTQ